MAQIAHLGLGHGKGYEFRFGLFHGELQVGWACFQSALPLRTSDPTANLVLVAILFVE